MSTFRLYLWKEWREQRGALAALGLSLPVLVFAVGYSLPRRQVTETLFIGIVGALALILSLVVIGGEILAIDRRRGTWLERLPRGLDGAFPAKLVAFTLISIAAVVYGHGLGLGLALMRDSGFTLRKPSAPGLVYLSVLAFSGAMLALWTFAASAWCARGALALLAGALVAAVVSSPAWGLWLFFVHEYEPSVWEVASTSVVLLCAPLASAWFGFTRGQRLGRGLGSAAWRGGAVGFGAAAPLLVWSLVQLERRDDIDLADEGCEIVEAWVTPDGHAAVVAAQMHRQSGWHRSPVRALWIDFEHGVARDMELTQPSLHTLLTHPRNSHDRPQPLLRIVAEEGAFDWVDSDEEPHEMRDQDAPFAWPAGLGWVTYEGSGLRFRYHDPFSGVTLGRHELPLEGGVWITPWGWVLHEKEWLLYDPRQGSLESLDWIDWSFREVAMSKDGRLLLTPGDGSLALLDLESRELLPISGRTEGNGYLEALDDALGHPDELLISDNRNEYRVDLECLEVTPLGLSNEEFLLRRLADGTLVIWTSSGFEWRGVRGELSKAVRFDELVFSEEGMP